MDPTRQPSDVLSAARHRFLNDLSLVHSLLGMAMARTSDSTAIDLFESSRGRVRTIALAHTLAWQHGPSAEGGLRAYLLEVSRLATRERTPAAETSLELAVDRVHLEFDQIVTLGLLVHELVTYALELTLPERPARLSVELSELDGGELSLRVRDDGAAAAALLPKTEGLSWKIAGLLAEQLSGHLELDSKATGSRELGVRFPALRKDGSWPQS